MIKYSHRTIKRWAYWQATEQENICRILQTVWRQVYICCGGCSRRWHWWKSRNFSLRNRSLRLQVLHNDEKVFLWASWGKRRVGRQVHPSAAGENHGYAYFQIWKKQAFPVPFVKSNQRMRKNCFMRTALTVAPKHIPIMQRISAKTINRMCANIICALHKSSISAFRAKRILIYWKKIWFF